MEWKVLKADKVRNTHFFNSILLNDEAKIWPAHLGFWALAFNYIPIIPKNFKKKIRLERKWKVLKGDKVV